MGSSHFGSSYFGSRYFFIIGSQDTYVQVRCRTVQVIARQSMSSLKGVVALTLLVVVSSVNDAAYWGCGWECTQNSDCGACGGPSGKCSCPDGQNVPFFEESCTCVSAPATNVPTSPAMNDVEHTQWPKRWTADVRAWGYGDFSHKTQNANGKFFYDYDLGKTRADWTPYSNGKDAKQIWISSTGGTSTYYVKSNIGGPLSFCLKFPISDPGAHKAPVGVEKFDWMKSCKDAGYAHYVGREQIHVDSTKTDEWVDHWSCRLDYIAANQSITFQNWHSLGLGKVKLGLPLRVTGGNSAPNPTQGSPRLNTVWYENFGFETSEADFSIDDFHLCVPVGKQEVTEFFGHEVTDAHAFSPDFHRRAHYMPLVKASTKDLKRARKPTPGRAFVRDTFADTMGHLNGMLKREDMLRTQPCSNFTGSMLREVQRELFDARTPALNHVYQQAGDTRRMVHGNIDELLKEQGRHVSIEKERPDLVRRVNDGICHEVVMWYVHHLSETVREQIKDRIVLPLLPEVRHEQPTSATDSHAHGVHGRYKDQISCAICHVKGGTATPTITV